MNLHRFVVGGLLTAAITFAMSISATAADWKPERVTIVIAHGVGGGQDRMTRELGEVWSKHLGVPVIFENVRGGSGRKGYDHFLTQPADGSVVLSSNLASASIMYAQQQPGWTWEEKVHPAGIFAVDPGAFFVRKDSPFQTLQDVIDAAGERPLSLALSFWASPDNMLVHQVMDKTGTEIQVVPIGKGSEVVATVLGGHTDVGYTKIANILKVGADTMRFLSVSLPENPVPGLTSDAPTDGSALGYETLAVASFRSIVLHQELVDQHPERAQWLIEALEAAKDDPAYIEAATAGGLNPDLIVDMDHDALMGVIGGYWDTFDSFGQILSEDKS